MIFIGLSVHSHRYIVTESTAADPLTDEVAAGKKVWEHHACINCHTILGEGAYFAPEVANVMERWGEPEADPFYLKDRQSIALSVSVFGNVAVGIQPARGYNIDPTDTYHSPDLVPPHGYIAFYAWLRNAFGANAIIHMGKHGNLEWLPGKATALSETCWPEIVLGATPNLYPFIVNDPGEGTQAKRRICATILDHLTPPLTRAESYGPLRDLEALVDEYYEAMGVDKRRIDHLKKEILSLTATTGIDKDVGMEGETEEDLQKLDAYLCELKEAQIRDGLHIFGSAPTSELADNLALALVRIPRGDGLGEKASIQRALADDLNLDFDPLDCEMAKPWNLHPAIKGTTKMLFLPHARNGLVH